VLTLRKVAIIGLYCSGKSTLSQHLSQKKYEIGFDQWFDKVILLDAPRSIRIDRAKKREGSNYSSQKLDVSDQRHWDIERIKKRANYVIDTCKSGEKRYKEVGLALQGLTANNNISGLLPTMSVIQISTSKVSNECRKARSRSKTGYRRYS
jgi:dephospho-CoA kinase